MYDLDDSLTDIDWLNSLRIKKATNIKDVEPIVAHKSVRILTESSDVPPVDSNSKQKYNKHKKPTYSYAYLIKLAIESSKTNKMKLNEIYTWIMETFPYYKSLEPQNLKGWKNAIRHNLSLNKVFKRCPKIRSESGKGSYWKMDSDCEENSIQDPPVKKIKMVTRTPINPVNTSDNPKTVTPTEKDPVISLISDSEDNYLPDYNSQFSSTKSSSSLNDISINPPVFQTDHKIDILSNSFSDRSAFVPYSIHNSNSCRISKMSTYEISYPPTSVKYSSPLLQTPNMTYSNYSQRHHMKNDQPLLEKSYEPSFGSLGFLDLLKMKYTKNSLEIEEGDNGGENDVIQKTPVLSQINTGPDFKDTIEENFPTKLPKFLGYYPESSESIYDTNHLYDSFLSFQQSLFESDTTDSKYVFPPNYSEIMTCREISFSQNLFLSTISQLSTPNNKYQSNVNQSLFEGNRGLSQNTKNILLNVCGLNDNLASSSRWSQLGKLNLDSPIEQKPNQSTCESEIIPSQEFLEMKNYLRCHRFKNDRLSESNKPSSVSTSSTVKSSGTVHSKSPACDKKIDAINSKEVLIVIDQVSKSQISEEDDDIEDCCNWDTFI